MEKIVVTHGEVEQVARRNPRRIGIVVLGARRGQADERGPVLSRSAGGRERYGRGGMLAAAEQSSLELLIGGEAAQVNRSSVRHRHFAGHQPAVVTPVETDPWSGLPGLILHVRGLVEAFVVVDAERE